MRLRTRRKIVYATTVLTLLALVGGYAAATLISTVTSSGQNGFNVTAPTNTIYGGGSQTTDLVDTTASVCTPNGGTVAPASGVTTANVYVTGEVACQTSTADWFEELSFHSATVSSATVTDTFCITVSSNPPICVTVTFTGLTPGTSTVTANIFYELGASAVAVPSDVAVNGS